MLPLLLVLTVQAQKKNDFQLQRELPGVTEKGWYSVRLPKEVMSEVSVNLEDLRIFEITETDTLEVPYLINIRTDKTEEKEVDFKLLNRTRRNGYSFYTFKIPGKRIVNHIYLDMDGDNFDARVMVEGSFRQTQWDMIADEMRIIGISNTRVTYRYTELVIPPSNFPYIRLKVRSDNSLRLLKGKLYQRETEEGSFEVFENTYDETQNSEMQQTQIGIKLDGRFPVSSLEIDAGHSRDFYRKFVLEGYRDSARQKLTLHHGVLTSVGKNHYNFPIGFVDSLNLRIYNYDDQPVELKSLSVKGPVYELVSELEEGKRYVLAYKAPKAHRPQYDIVYFRDKVPNDLPTVDPGEATNLAEVKEAEDNAGPDQIWVWVIMGVVILVLGAFSFKMMKS